MAATNTPLRYPGGKSCLIHLVTGLIKINKMERWSYAEPYAGGCGLALSLLYGGHVSEIHINDFDASIWSFWNSVLNDTDIIIKLIEKTPVDMKNWKKQKKIQMCGDIENPLKLGFATFFLNRTNRSGIIKRAGVIGGYDQTGNYKMDCRFNKETLIKKIKRVARYRSQIHLSGLDAIEFMSKSSDLPDETFYCIDPPYYSKGSELYTSFYNKGDHADVAEKVLELNRPWVVTYDNVPEIQKLYSRRRQFEFDINYSLQQKRIGSELLIASKGLKITPEIKARQATLLSRRAA